MTTLLRALIDSTGMARRPAFAAIREGRVRVGGTAVADPSSEYEGGALTLDGRVLHPSTARKVYLLLHKPQGYVTTASDELGRATVFDLVPERLQAPGLHSVGRLDKDTTGLLLLTNDGDLTYHLTHPKHEVDKEYWLQLARVPTHAQLEAVRRGIELDGALRRPIDLRELDPEQPRQFSITLAEGRKREVRRMFEAVGARVTYLMRVREGDLYLDDLEEGKVRPLTRQEEQALGVRVPRSG